ncbi:MAG: hypothetical protein ACJ74Z_06005 [Bryobacteraceae bacterium]
MINCRPRWPLLSVGGLLGLGLCTLANAQDQPGAMYSSSQASADPAPTNGAADPDSGSHIGFTLYLWFPGTNGTMGAGGHDVHFRASAGDLLSNSLFGLMGAVNVEHRGFVLLTDVMWVRLRATNAIALPFPGLPPLSAEVKANQVIANPEIGYRFVNREKVKIDALWGIRYWHLDSSLQFTPSLLALNFSGSQDWVDPLMGARFQFSLSPRVLVTLRGDAGAWSAANLDYQVQGVLGLKVTQKLILGVGYRYLYVDYRPPNFVFDTAMTGPGVALTYNFR